MQALEAKWWVKMKGSWSGAGTNGTHTQVFSVVLAGGNEGLSYRH